MILGVPATRPGKGPTNHEPLLAESREALSTLPVLISPGLPCRREGGSSLCVGHTAWVWVLVTGCDPCLCNSSFNSHHNLTSQGQFSFIRRRRNRRHEEVKSSSVQGNRVYNGRAGLGTHTFCLQGRHSQPPRPPLRL